MNRIKVLIADDVEQTRSEIERLLCFENDLMVVGQAKNGEEAVKLAEELTPDVVLMDVNMPRMDGIQAAEIITMRHPGVATIIVSIQGEHEYLRRAMIAGARDYLVKPFNADDLVATIRKVYKAESTRVFMREKITPGFDGTRGKVIAVCSPKGGAGKTLIATNLAVALTQQKAGRVALLDLDLQFGDVSLMLNLEGNRTLGRFVHEKQVPDIELVENCLIPHFSGLWVMVGAGCPKEAEMLKTVHINETIRLCKEKFDWIVVDTSPGLTETTLDVAEMADTILLAVTPDLSSVKTNRLFIEALDVLYCKEKMHIVLNRSTLKPGLKPVEVERGLGGKIWQQVPNDDVSVGEAINKGVPPVLGRRNSSLGQSIGQMAEDLMGNEYKELPAANRFGRQNKLIR